MCLNLSQHQQKIPRTRTPHHPVNAAFSSFLLSQAMEHSTQAASAVSPLTDSSPKRISFLAPVPPLLPQTTLSQISKNLQLVRADGHVPVLLWDFSATHDTAGHQFPASLGFSLLFSLWMFSPTPRRAPLCLAHSFQPFQATLGSLINPIVLIPHVHRPPVNLLVSPDLSLNLQTCISNCKLNISTGISNSTRTKLTSLSSTIPNTHKWDLCLFNYSSQKHEINLDSKNVYWAEMKRVVKLIGWKDNWIGPFTVRTECVKMGAQVFPGAHGGTWGHLITTQR